ncbi:MAG TPA: hypothetical protein VJV03_13260 [Pyrinomonadaceae bacterium]|nr:hypothetical protein [Pyrinomonadaceae bacterium]
MKLSFLAALFLFAAGTVKPQTITFENGQLPEGWKTTGAATVSEQASTNGGKFSVMLSGAQTTLVSNRQSSVGLLTFHTAALPKTHDIELAVQISTNGTDYVPVAKFSLNSSVGSTKGDKLFDRQLVPLNTLGDVYVRWEISRWASGLLFLDEINFEPMSPAEVERETRARREEEQRKLINDIASQAAAKIEYRQVISSFDEMTVLYKSRMLLLANLNDRVNTIKITTDLANATTARNQMANPFKYNYFNDLTNKLGKVLPEPKSSRLNNVLNIVKQVASGASTVASMFTGINFRSFADSVKGLFADGLTKQSILARRDELEDQAKQAGGKDKIQGYAEKALAITDALKTNVSTYKDAQQFLDIMTDENERLSKLANELNEVNQEAELLRSELRAYLAKYLEATGTEAINEDTLNYVIARRPETLDRLGKKSAAYFNAAKQKEEGFTGSFSSEQAALLRNMEARFRDTDELERKYNVLVGRLLTFLNHYSEDVKRDSPFRGTNLDPDDTWGQNKRIVMAVMDRLPEQVRESYLRTNLYSGPTF